MELESATFAKELNYFQFLITQLFILEISQKRHAQSHRLRSSAGGPIPWLSALLSRERKYTLSITKQLF
jgi:hypothetical protein